jgi:GNAT superfamily N-acetyltransferase
VKLSQAFAREYAWAGDIPIGKISTIPRARQKLLGSKVVLAKVAQTNGGSFVGYAGVYRHPEGYDMSLLIDRAYRRSGIGRQLVESVFQALPAGLRVEAWVGDFNPDSLAATPNLGFRPDRTLVHNQHTIHIFVRDS